jgi:hypothetical protein
MKFAAVMRWSDGGVQPVGAGAFVGVGDGVGVGLGDAPPAVVVGATGAGEV